MTCRSIKILGQRVDPNSGREMAYVLCEYLQGALEGKGQEELDRVEWMIAGRSFSQ